MSNSKPLWTPSAERIAAAPMTGFARACEAQSANKFETYGEFHQWSIDENETFWNLLWDEAGIIGTKGEKTLSNPDKMPGATYFDDATLSFAENLLSKTGSDPAIIFRGEDKLKTSKSWDELHADVSRIQQAFKQQGIKPGDRIAAMVPNTPETVACMLAANSIGAIWSSCSPDFGVKGVLDRFMQIEPSLFITCDGYWYNGKRIEIDDKISEIAPQLSAKITVVMPYLGNVDAVVGKVEACVSLDDFIAPFEAKPVAFEKLPFSHPLYILFSSGTTGIPKCIVHGQGGTLLQHVKEHWLHCGVEQGDRVFYFTTCGWMMWNWLVTALARKATLMLYDGSPFYPDGNAIFDYAQEERFSFFGTSAKYIDAVRNSGLRPIESHDLSTVRAIASTGSPLSPENFEFVYQGIKQDVHLASVSGGTDIVACFVSAVPWNPVYSGEIQGPALGMASDVWDDSGQSMNSGKGELVCSKPFPSMPISFWNDADGSKYFNAYFARFENVWCHGDFAEWTENGGMVIHGRSDATLNPGGVRIGTAEIYNQVEQLSVVEEALCIGQDWDNDTRVVLFVRLAPGTTLTDELQQTIRNKIRTGASPRHVPAVIVEVEDIPRTKSGKITELAVRDIVHGREVKNQEALANPEALELYRDIPALMS